MADEDEIDVLGDFSLDNLLSKNESGISSCYDNSVLNTQNSELLSCDYSLNSQWLLENPTANTDCWYSGAGNEFTEDGNSTNTSLGFDEVICTENKTTDESGWTEEEKTSLHKGLEIFGKNSTNLSQFIGSKTSSQVKYYLKHYYTKNVTQVSFAFSNIYNTVEINKQSAHATASTTGIPTVFQMSDIIEDSQIPASIEEVIAAVSTATPTVQNIYKKPLNNKKTLNTKKKINTKNIPSKKLKAPQSLLSKYYHLKNYKVVERKRIKSEKSDRSLLKSERIQNEINYTEVQNTTLKIPPVLPVSSGEEVIKIKKEADSESDTEIDIDIDEDVKEIPKVEIKPIAIKEEINYNNIINIKKEINKYEVENVISKENENTNDLLNRRLKSISGSVLQYLMSNEIPTKDCILENNVITDVEKTIHSEFFEGRPTKTPSRYLKIRKHIIDYWLENKPQYCTKTAVRQGLKNCGDVNCIGRVHQYLEQIGAINFGCEQITYIRPLLNIITAVIQPKEKSTLVVPPKLEIVRPRMKKKYNNDGEGGYTMMHDENGVIIDTTVVNQDKQSKPRNRRQNIKLVYCKGFTDENPAPYSIIIHLSALLLIDMHAHSALIEVMGLLGGFYDHENQMLHITQYKPCLGIDHSNTHCDMCPVSQSEASELLHGEGVEVIGWFHSHPTFYPNPSLQDIDTQLNMQLYLSNKYKPFVGVILSPFRPSAATLVSEYRCLIVDKTEQTKDELGVPYKFQTTLSSKDFQVDLFLQYASDMFMTKNNIPKEFIVDFNKAYFQDTSISYLEKLLASVKLHLARCSDVNKMTCDAIVSGITEICLSTSNT